MEEYIYLVKEGVITLDHDITTEVSNEEVLGKTLEDWKEGKYILLDSKQVEFYQLYPEASPEEIFYCTLMEEPEGESESKTDPSEDKQIQEEGQETERTLEDAKQELHVVVDEFAESLKTFRLGDENVWFSNLVAEDYKVRVESSYNTSVTLYDDSGKPHLLLAETASSMLATISHYDSECKDLVYSLHQQVNTIPSLEFADSIDINDYIQNVPESPVFDASGEIHVEYDYEIIYKYDNAYGNNFVPGINEGENFHIDIYPHNGFTLSRENTIVEVNGVPVEGIFDDDEELRPDYSGAAHFDVFSANGPISVIGTALDSTMINNGAYDEPEEPEIPQEEPKDRYNIQYKLSGCRVDNDITSIAAGDSWKTTIYPEDGLAIYIPDFTAEMGGKPLDVVFGPDTLERTDYASYAQIRIDEGVTGDIFIAGIAH